MEVVTVSEHRPRSNGFGIARQVQPGRLRPIDPSQLSRYDLLLLTIPLVLLLAGLIGAATAVPLWTAMSVGALISIPLLADGLAVNPPR